MEPGHCMTTVMSGGKKRGGKEGKDVEGRRNIGNHTRKSGSGEFGPANWYSISIWGHPSSSGRGGRIGRGSGGSILRVGRRLEGLLRRVVARPRPRPSRKRALLYDFAICSFGPLSLGKGGMSIQSSESWFAESSKTRSGGDSTSGVGAGGGGSSKGSGSICSESICMGSSDPPDKFKSCENERWKSGCSRGESVCNISSCDWAVAVLVVDVP